MTKDLQEKAIDIKGKQYVLVSDRIIYFNKTYSKGSIITALVSKPSDQMVVIKAKVTPDATMPDRYFTGYSQATWGEGMVNKTAALENAETSAVGRALAMMGIGVIDSVASVDEMNKATNTNYSQKTPQNGFDSQSDTIQFGKHSGKKWSEVPIDYLSWLSTSEKGNPAIKQKAADELKLRAAEKLHTNDSEESISPEDIPF